MNKKIIVPLTLLSILSTVVFFDINGVKAYNSTNELSPMIQKMIEKFNLNQDQVKKFVNEEKTLRQTEMQKQYELKLNELVKSGKLTELQKSALIAKHKEMWNKKQSYMSLPKDEKRLKMQEERQKFEEWATTKGIDLSLIKPEGKGFGRQKGIN